MNILLLHWFVYVVLQRHLMVLWNTVWSLCDYLCPDGTVMASRISERQKLYYKKNKLSSLLALPVVENYLHEIQIILCS